MIPGKKKKVVPGVTKRTDRDDFPYFDIISYHLSIVTDNRRQVEDSIRLKVFK